MKIIGHAGAKGLAPANTLLGFERAIEAGVDEIECDVRVTRDGVVVLCHYPFARDNAGERMNIANTSIGTLRTYSPDMPTLEAAIATINKRVPLMLDIKPHVATEQVITILRAFLAKGWQAEDFELASFDLRVLRTMHRALPEIPVVVIERWSSVRARWRAHRLGTKRLSMNANFLWSGLLRSMHQAGYQISPYRLNNPVKAAKWAPYLYGVITAYPDRFKK